MGILFKEVISGWSAGCDEGAGVTDHKELSQNISIHSNLTKKQHSVNIPQLTTLPIQEPTCLFMVNGLHVPITVPFLNQLERQTWFLWIQLDIFAL